MSGDVIAEVRYTAFSEPPERPGLRTRSLRKKQVMGPSGHSYTFRQEGRPTNPCSQWLPVRESEDVETFRDREGFEVRQKR